MNKLKKAMSKKFHTTLPDNYPVCQLTECPMADTCLHQMAYATMLERDDFINLVNPARCSTDGACRFYRDSKPVIYARGFTNFQKRMFPDQYSRFMAICIGHWSRNPYFERRRGEHALPPNEQEFILKTLKKVGVTDEMKFDNYEENTNWYD